MSQSCYKAYIDVSWIAWAHFDYYHSYVCTCRDHDSKLNQSQLASVLFSRLSAEVVRHKANDDDVVDAILARFT